MFNKRSLESLIREKVFLGPLSNTGFHMLKCPCCNDYKVRGGFKFEDNKVFYSCFNCGLRPIYEENSGEISKKMRRVLNDFGIQNSEIDEIINVAFFNKKENEDSIITLDSLKQKNLSTFTPEVKLPNHSFRIGSSSENGEIQNEIIRYLTSRNIDVNTYPFYFSTDKYFSNRVIIPYYRNKKIIYWQARSITEEEPRYLNCDSSKTSVIFNFDQLYSWSDLPLFVAEGVFDALPLNGIATLGGTLNEQKIELLNKSKRKLIFIIDKDAIGGKMGRTAIENNWTFTFAPENCDVNKSITKYGKLWTIHELMKNIPKNKFEAELSLKMNCNKDPRKEKKY